MFVQQAQLRQENQAITSVCVILAARTDTALQALAFAPHMDRRNSPRRPVVIAAALLQANRTDMKDCAASLAVMGIAQTLLASNARMVFVVHAVKTCSIDIILGLKDANFVRFEYQQGFYCTCCQQTFGDTGHVSYHKLLTYLYGVLNNQAFLTGCITVKGHASDLISNMTVR